MYLFGQLSFLRHCPLVPLSFVCRCIFVPLSSLRRCPCCAVVLLCRYPRCAVVLLCRCPFMSLSSLRRCPFCAIVLVAHFVLKLASTYFLIYICRWIWLKTSHFDICPSTFHLTILHAFLTGALEANVREIHHHAHLRVYKQEGFL